MADLNNADITGSAGAVPAASVQCPFCDEQISVRARKCRHCGETVDVAMRKAEEALRASERHGGNVYMNAAVAHTPAYSRPQKSRGLAIVLALFVGGLGLHKFYLGRTAWGIVYLIFCWTFIPSGIALIEGIVYALSNDESFHHKYG